MVHFLTVSVGCSMEKHTKHLICRQVNHKDQLVCTDGAERDPSVLSSSLNHIFFSHHLCFPLISLHFHSQFQSLNFVGVCWHITVHYTNQGWFYWHKFNTCFNVFFNRQ